MKRRTLVKGLGAGGVAAALAPLLWASNTRPLDILFMGGTGFLGPHTVRALVEAGHRLTLFNRGRTNPGLFSALEQIRGDRLSDEVELLGGRRWDVIVDTSCYVPRAVRMLLAAVDRSQLKQYVLISTVSVYRDFSKSGLDENSPLATLPDPDSEDVREHYGALKALCEAAAEEALPGRVMKVRSGLIVGPGDRSDRFTYWPQRYARGGEMLAPGNGRSPLQLIDVRDLAEWIALSVARGTVGTFNATSPSGHYDFKQLMRHCGEVLKSDTTLTWVPEAFLLDQGVTPLQDLPLWAGTDGEYAGIWQVNSEKAARAGLRHRALRDSVRDTHTWFQSQPAARREALRAGWSREDEARVLAAWRRVPD
jgi:2'-hydroxyisoflavone reductase